MTLRFRLPTLQLLSALLIAGVSVCAPHAAFSQAGAANDSVTLKPRTATERPQQMNGVFIAGVKGTKVAIRNQQGEISYDLSQIQEVRKNPPPEFVQGQQFIEAGQLDKALPLINAVAVTYRGLPTTWASDANAMLGNIYVSLGKLAEAEAAFSEFEKAYPAAGAGPASIGKARLAAERQNFADARSVAEPLVADALTKKTVTREESMLYGQAYFVLGKVAEGEGKDPEAMENYCRTVAIFYQERAVVKEAQKRIDELRKKGITTP